VGHTAAMEPSLVGRRGPEPQHTWQCQSPPQQEGGDRSRNTRDSVGALPSGEAESSVVRQVLASEHSSPKRQGLEPRDA
jgi:hypothetical protein